MNSTSLRDIKDDYYEYMLAGIPGEKILCY